MILAQLLGTLSIALMLASSDPAQGQNQADRELSDRIGESLRAARGLELDGVEITVRSGAVLLRGKVPLLDHSLRIEQRIWQADGVVDIENELRVTPLRSVPDSELEKAILRLIEADPRFVAAKVTASVAKGAVTLDGTFQGPGDILDLKHRVAMLDGVLSIRIEAALIAAEH